MTISFEPSEEQTLILEAVSAFASGELADAMRTHEAEGVSAKVRRTYAEMGMDRVLFPEALGGMGAGLTTAVLISEALSKTDAGASVALQSWDLLALALRQFGSDEQTQRLLGLAANGNWCAIALSEAAPAEGVGFATRAETVDGGYRLVGEKRFVTQAEGAAVTLVFAQVDGATGWDGIGVFAVEGTPEGVSVADSGRRTGLRAAPLHTVTLDGAFVPETGRLLADSPREGLRAFFGQASLIQAARCVGVMESTWTYARDYVSEREAFGKPIGHFQAVAFNLSDMLILTDASRWAVWHAAHSLDTGDKRALQAAAAAVAQTFESANRVTEDGVQLLGGAGFTEDYPCEKWMRDARTLSLAYGTYDVAIRALGHELMGSAGEADLDELVPLGHLQPVLT